MIDKRSGESKKAPKTQDSYFNDGPAMSRGSEIPSQRKAPKGPHTGQK